MSERKSMPIVSRDDFGNQLKIQSLRFLAGAGFAQGGVFYLVDDNLNARDYVTFGIDSSIHTNYLNYYDEVDPLHARHYIHTDRNVVTEKDVARGLYRKCEQYLNEFLKPCGLNHIMEVFLRSESRIIAGLSLIRAEPSRPFTAREIESIEQAREYVEFNVRQFMEKDRSSNVDPLWLIQQSLTRKELQIFELLCDGACNKKISLSLFIEESTVKTHLRHIYSKFIVSNRRELLALIFNHGKP
tara:strand:- start:4498 stop:5226 length:729 start_codon:yes stop_codon:yes gene_type:complete